MSAEKTWFGFKQYQDIAVEGMWCVCGSIKYGRCSSKLSAQ